MQGIAWQKLVAPVVWMLCTGSVAGCAQAGGEQPDSTSDTQSPSVATEPLGGADDSSDSQRNEPSPASTETVDPAGLPSESQDVSLGALDDTEGNAESTTFVDADAGLPDAGSPVDAGLPASEEEGDDEAGCPFAGSVSYQLNAPETWPEDALQRIDAAISEAVRYYNCYADLQKAITVNYNPGVPTAEANVDGYLSFGSNPAYMVLATAMHEVSHTLGVGYFPWGELIVDGRWAGAEVNELMASLPPEERDPDAFSQRDFITADGQHFWPYGLNQASEHQSEWSLINNVRIVAAMQRDKQAYLDGQ